VAKLKQESIAASKHSAVPSDTMRKFKSHLCSPLSKNITHEQDHSKSLIPNRQSPLNQNVHLLNSHGLTGKCSVSHLASFFHHRDWGSIFLKKEDQAKIFMQRDYATQKQKTR